MTLSSNVALFVASGATFSGARHDAGLSSEFRVLSVCSPETPRAVFAVHVDGKNREQLRELALEALRLWADTPEETGAVGAAAAIVVGRHGQCLVCGDALDAPAPGCPTGHRPVPEIVRAYEAARNAMAEGRQ